MMDPKISSILRRTIQMKSPFWMVSALFFLGTLTLALEPNVLKKLPCKNGLCVVFQVTIEKNQDGTYQLKKKPQAYLYRGRKYYRYIETYELKKNSCSKKVLVPKAVYLSIMEVLKTVGGKTPTAILTPAQKAMLMFYSTIMKQTVGFRCQGFGNKQQTHAFPR